MKVRIDFNPYKGVEYFEEGSEHVVDRIIYYDDATIMYFQLKNEQQVTYPFEPDEVEIVA